MSFEVLIVPFKNIFLSVRLTELNYRIRMLNLDNKNPIKYSRFPELDFIRIINTGKYNYFQNL